MGEWAGMLGCLFSGMRAGEGLAGALGRQQQCWLSAAVLVEPWGACFMARQCGLSCRHAPSATILCQVVASEGWCHQAQGGWHLF